VPLDPRDLQAWEYAIDPSLTAEEAQMRAAALWDTPDPVQQVVAGQESPTLIASNDPGFVPQMRAGDVLGAAPTLDPQAVLAAEAEAQAKADAAAAQEAQRRAEDAAAINEGRAQMGLPPVQASAPAAAPATPAAQPVAAGVIPVGGAQASVAATGPQTPASTTGALMQDILKEEWERSQQGRSGTYVEGGPVKTQFQVQKGKPLTPEQEQVLREQADREANLTKQGLDVSAATSAAAAEQAQAQAEKLGDQMIDFRLGQQEAQKAVAKQREQVDRLTDEAKYNPHAFWEDRGVFGNMLSMIGFAMMGAGGASAKDVIGIVEGHNQEDLQNKLRKREGAQSKLDELSQGVLNPAAMNEYTMGIRLKQAAFEMDAMAASMRSKELQQQGFLEAEKVRQEAERRIIEAQRLEADTVSENWMQTQGRYVGGKRPETRDEFITREAKESGRSYEEVAASLAEAERKGGPKKDKGADGGMLKGRIAIVEAALEQAIKFRNKHNKMGNPGIWKQGGLGASKESKELVSDINAMVPGIDMAQQGGTAPNESTMQLKFDAYKSRSGDQIKEVNEANIRSLQSTLDKLRAGEDTPADVPLPSEQAGD
jgi:hypothetical protein